MAKSKRTPREEIERAFHVSFKLPEQSRQLLDNYRDQVLTEAAEMLRAADVGFHETDGVDAAADLLLAARTTKEH